MVTALAAMVAGLCTTRLVSAWLEPTFIGCVGQGGTGIQSSPGAGQLVADLTLDGRPGPTFAGLELDPAAFDPARFRSSGQAEHPQHVERAAGL